MARDIFTVSAWIVDANGTKNYLSGYPKDFDSKNYDGDVEKARKRADGDFAEAYGSMCKRDDRQIQTVTLTDVRGFQLDSKFLGNFVEPVQEEE